MSFLSTLCKKKLFRVGKQSKGNSEIKLAHPDSAVNNFFNKHKILFYFANNIYLQQDRY